jgi:hypothetical protein
LLNTENKYLRKQLKSNKMKAKKSAAFSAMQEKMAKKQGKPSPMSKKANTAMGKMKGKAKY